MTQTLFTNIMVFDGTGKKTYPGEVLVQGNQVRTVAKGTNQIARDGAKTVDGGGATLMPGLVEAHAHVTYNDCSQLPQIGALPPEEHMILALKNAKVMLDQGFTSLFSAAGTTKLRIEVALRDAINKGDFPGPRLLACSPEITSTGGLGDERLLHLNQESVGLIADGADEVLRAARLCAREGVDNLKINISGDQFARNCGMEALSYGDAEVAAAVWVARERGLNICTHARADAAVRMALKHGIDIIYHADFASAKTIDMIEAKKKKLFLAPAVGVVYTTAYEAGDWGVTKEVAENMQLFRKLENTYRVYQELRKRGVRVLPGGDYGFAWNPIGTNARDLEHFVNLFGYSPAEALRAATQWGGELMGLNLGVVKQGYLADLLLVDGDPTHDVTILQDRDNLLMVMKDGAFHKPPQTRRIAQRRAAGAAAAE